MNEHFFQCPYCGESISMLFDSSIEAQDYIEECEVSCNPIKIHLVYNNSELVSLNIESIEQ